MKKARLFLTSLLLISLLILGSTDISSAQETKSLRIGIMPDVDSIPILLAKEKF